MKVHLHIYNVRLFAVINRDELNINHRAPSPDPSIRIEMQEYSDEESSSPEKQAPNVGWTFYSNVFRRVQEIIENDAKSVTSQDGRQMKEDFQKMKKVKAATLEQLARMGHNFNDTQEDFGRNRK